MSLQHGVVESPITLKTDGESLRLSSDIVDVAMINCSRSADDIPIAATTVSDLHDDDDHDDKEMSSDINSLTKTVLKNGTVATGDTDCRQADASIATRTPANGRQQQHRHPAHSSPSPSSSSSSVPSLPKQSDSNEFQEQTLRNEHGLRAPLASSSSEHADQEPDQERPATSSIREAPDCDKNKRKIDADRLDNCPEQCSTTNTTAIRLAATISSSWTHEIVADRDREMVKSDENLQEQTTQVQTMKQDQQKEEVSKTKDDTMPVVNDKLKMRCRSLTTAPSSEQLSKKIETDVVQEEKFKLPIASATKFTNSPSSATTKTAATNVSTTAIDDSDSDNSGIDMAIDASLAIQRRIPQRKASVFSHNGFLGLHKLDPKTLQQHTIHSHSSGDLKLNQDKAIDKSDSEEILMLQQQAQQQQVMIATTSGVTATTTVANAASNKNMGEDLLTNSKTASAISGATTTPRRSNRSDTLGSTGSSRASSCDEPTIVSPKLKLSAQLKLDNDTRAIIAARKRSSQTSTTDSSISSIDSISCDNDTAPPKKDDPIAVDTQDQDVIMTIKAEPSADSKAEATLGKQTDESTHPPSPAPISMAVDANNLKSSIGLTTSDELIDDVFSSASTNDCRSRRHIPPPFESIKTQIKRNSVPNADFIKRHIERLISQNEAIIENWNQISIRSYNSQAATSSPSGVTSASAVATSTSLSNIKGTPLPLFKGSSKPANVDDKDPLANGNKRTSSSGSLSSIRQTLPRRPSKRWSTTALGNGISFDQLQSVSHSQIASPSSNDKQASTSGVFDPPSKVASELNQLVEARLRRRSHNNQHPIKRHSLRQSVLQDSCLNSILLSPTLQRNTSGAATTTAASELAKARRPNELNENNQYQHGSQFLFGPLPATSSSNYFNSTSSSSSSVPSSPKPPTNSITDIQNYLNQRLSITSDGAKGLSEHGPDLNELACTNLGQSIENAIKNLSLRRQEEQQQQQQQHQQQLIQQQLSCALRQDGHNTHHLHHDQNLLLNNALLLQKPDQQCNDMLMATILMERQRQQQLLEDHICQQQQQHALEQQFNLKRLADFERECQQQASASIIATSIQQQQSITTEQSQQLLQQIGRLNERQARESQVLNEFLARMMLNRDNQNNSTNPLHHQAHNHHPLLHQTDLLQQAQQQPIIRHGGISDQQQKQQPSDMFTQPLDSATPPHRCNACDVSFWTRDLLNYHMMTSCSARKSGSEPNAPIAFNFNQPNGYDQLLSPTNPHHSPHQPNWQLDLLRDSHLHVPSETQLGAMAHHQSSPFALTKSQSINLDLISQQQQQQQLIASFQQQNQDSNHLNVRNGLHSDVIHSKSASPPRRRTYNELDAPHQIDQVFKSDHETSVTRDRGNNNEHKRSILVAPASPHNSRESAELTWKQRLNELHLLKQQLLTTPTQQPQQQQQLLQQRHRQQASEHESNLPIKKRKISEPNMRY